MKLGYIVILLIALILISGCTQTGQVIEGELTQEEELVLDSFLNKTPEEAQTPQAPQAPYQGNTGPQNITQPLGCPETCSDQDNCTYDYCSEETGYECVHADRICPNFVRACPDGVEVVCKNTCIQDACTHCEPDCSEHQLFTCGLTQGDCGPCQTLNTENCECAAITSCIDHDGCCPSGCNYSQDQDCPEPEIPETPNVTITCLDYTEEWVEIGNFGNTGQDMANWTLEDNAIHPHVYNFPAFSLLPGAYLYVHTGHGTDNSTDLYWNRGDYVWNNDKDMATLKDDTGTTISQYSYE